MCCSMMQLSVNFIRTSGQRNRAELAWAWLRQLLPKLRLLRSTVKRGNCGCRPEFRCLVRYHSLRTRAHPFA